MKSPFSLETFWTREPTLWEELRDSRTVRWTLKALGVYVVVLVALALWERLR